MIISRITLKVIIVTSFSIMLLVSCFYYFITPSLVDGSAGNMMLSASINVAFPITLTVIFGLFLSLYLRNYNKIILAFLVLIFFLWILSGRVIGIVLWPNGMVNTGWFGIPNNEFHLCNRKDGCETTIYYQTKTEKLFFWRLRLKNNDVDEVIFIGPFIWNKTLSILKTSIGNGTDKNDEQKHDIHLNKIHR